MQINTVTEKKKDRSVSIPVFGNERCVAQTVLKFISPLKCVEKWHRCKRSPYEDPHTVRLLESTEFKCHLFRPAKWDRMSQSDARLFGGELTNHRQPEKLLLIGLNHQEDPDSKAGDGENQYQRHGY